MLMFFYKTMHYCCFFRHYHQSFCTWRMFNRLPKSRL